MHQPTAPIPCFGFDARHFAPASRFDAWRALLPGYELRAAVEGAAPELFDAAATAWALGPVRITAGRMAACRSHRTPALLRRDGEDGFAVHVLAGGGWRGEFAGLEARAGDGEPILVDHARETRALAEDCGFVSLDLDRDALDAVLPPGAARHGAVLRGAAGALLAEHLRALARALPALDGAEAPLLASATRDLLAACLAPDAGRIERARPALERARLGQARRLVEDGLRGGDLRPESLARALGASRSALYRLFEPLGGVAAYVRSRRLAAARRALRDPLDHRRVSAIAYEFGFGGEAQFSRAFRRAFGHSPSEARAGVPAELRVPPGADARLARRYRDWLLGLG